MVDKLLPPDERRIRDDLIARVEALEKAVRQEDVDRSQRVRFSLAGPLTLATSVPVRFEKGGYPDVVLTELGTAGTTMSEVTVYKNGAVIGTIAVGPGANPVKSSFGDFFQPDIDTFQIGITGVGTGAKDWTAEVRIR